ncbi:MAG: hypothetical protein AB1634_17815 [Thermodesulfobacteriota bacterium]
MRQLVLDELRPAERQAIQGYLAQHAQPAAIEGLFWLTLPDDLLAPAQRSHPECAPFHLAIELTADALRFELLVRTGHRLHCPCMAHATPAQRDFLLRFADRLVADLDLRS